MSDLAATLETVLGDWAEAAACRGVDPDIFHPAVDGDYRVARSYCDRCPCRADCAAHALAKGERSGMWGGLDPDQRRRLSGTAHMAPPPDERAAQALDLYLDGMGIQKIAGRVNASTRTVTAWLQDAGINTSRRTP